MIPYDMTAILYDIQVPHGMPCGVSCGISCRLGMCLLLVGHHFRQKALFLQCMLYLVEHFFALRGNLVKMIAGSHIQKRDRFSGSKII